ncbi:transcriptional regulator NrdR [Helcococcus sueciensis]|uniref:transcriptional regulator NrdR n=1 Tax=Helcococcus sueciensis TaxID=241555 RepID=UPI0003F5AF42|nr:transcriptional regulator NrdR [Helcococcus sueciensis]
MKCPFCHFHDSKVIDTRPTDSNESIRRRRECLKCKKRFTTYERVEDQTVVVIKKDETREAFQRSKILNSLIKSSEKRPIEIATLEKTVEEIETEINHLNQKEVTSAYIGELVMNKLKNIDKIAYVRFASVYREFDDVQSFADEIENLKD